MSLGEKKNDLIWFAHKGTSSQCNVSWKISLISMHTVANSIEALNIVILMK
jgi:hypothetical protein